MKIEAASSEELRSIARRLVRDLPMLPVCLSALVQFDADDEHSFERILSVARNEPCMALRIFVLANHRYSSHKLTSLRKAVQVLGVDGMDELTHHHSIAEVFVPITEEERPALVSLTSCFFGSEKPCRYLSRSWYSPRTRGPLRTDPRPRAISSL